MTCGNRREDIGCLLSALTLVVNFSAILYLFFTSLIWAVIFIIAILCFFIGLYLIFENGNNRINKE